MSSTPIRDTLDIQDMSDLANNMADAQLVAYSAGQFSKEISSLWEKGMPPGDSTGWKSLDKHYTVMPGQFTVVTGWPGSGKSEWIDALSMNLARTKGWRIAFFSDENRPTEIHVAKLTEKFLGKPFADGVTPRMSRDELHEAIGEISQFFGFLDGAADSKRDVFTLDHILTAAQNWFQIEGIWRSDVRKGLVIDPWNSIEHTYPRHWTETLYISACLTGIRAWARNNNVHVWLVAHPQKLRRLDNGKLPVPRPDSISGSQHWWNKADNCITVFREFETEDQMPGTVQRDTVEVQIQKVRFKHVGSQGVAQLRYERATGRYFDMLKSV